MPNTYLEFEEALERLIARGVVTETATGCAISERLVPLVMVFAGPDDETP